MTGFSANLIETSRTWVYFLEGLRGGFARRKDTRAHPHIQSHTGIVPAHAGGFRSHGEGGRRTPFPLVLLALATYIAPVSESHLHVAFLATQILFQSS